MKGMCSTTDTSLFMFKSVAVTNIPIIKTAINIPF